MFRLTFAQALIAGAAVVVFGSGTQAQEASTVRIEPRPYYGATVTIEAGVRVFRPLPPTRRVIINPNNATPLSLSITDVRKTVRSRSTNHNYHYHKGPSSRGSAGFVGGFVGRGGRFFRGNRGFGGRTGAGRGSGGRAAGL